MYGKGKGNRKAQRKRHRRNNKFVPKQEFEYLLIDGNYSYQPYKYCKYYRAYLTKNLYLRHDCKNRHCHCLRELELEV